MTKLDIAGILVTYAEKISKARTKKQVKNHIKELKHELDLRKLSMEDGEHR